MLEMGIGPGKYDELCTLAREGAQAEGAVVIIFKGTRGSGFSVQGSLAVHEMVLDTLNAMVARERGDMLDLKVSTRTVMKYERMRSLLEELRTAYPALLFGEAWAGRINEVLDMPDDDTPHKQPAKA